MCVVMGCVKASEVKMKLVVPQIVYLLQHVKRQTQIDLASLLRRDWARLAEKA